MSEYYEALLNKLTKGMNIQPKTIANYYKEWFNVNNDDDEMLNILRILRNKESSMDIEIIKQWSIINRKYEKLSKPKQLLIRQWIKVLMTTTKYDSIPIDTYKMLEEWKLDKNFLELMWIIDDSYKVIYNNKPKEVSRQLSIRDEKYEEVSKQLLIERWIEVVDKTETKLIKSLLSSTKIYKNDDVDVDDILQAILFLNKYFLENNEAKFNSLYKAIKNLIPKIFFNKKSNSKETK